VISAGLCWNWVKVWVIKVVRTEMKSATYARFDDKQLIYREGSKK
jgi:hypothetical protein